MANIKRGIEFYDGEERVHYNEKFTKFLLELLKEFAKAASGKKYIIGGGLAVDLAYGELRRPHEDLDICPDENDLEFWQNWFVGKGLKVVITPDTFQYPNAFVVLDKDGSYVADVYCVKFEENGDVLLKEADVEGNESYKKWGKKSLNRCNKITFEGVEFVLEDYNDVIEQKLDHVERHSGELGEKHKIDLETVELIKEKTK